MTYSSSEAKETMKTFQEIMKSKLPSALTGRQMMECSNLVNTITEAVKELLEQKQADEIQWKAFPETRVLGELIRDLSIQKDGEK